MAQLISVVLVLGLVFLAFSPICFCGKTTGGYLYPQFYDRSCPKAREIVHSIVAKAVAKEARMAASLLRLHFHDCFVKGCDASVLLDSTGSIVSEKGSNPNRNSLRGFEVIDEIKSALEKECPQTVSCADIMALSARDSTVLTGGSSWEVPLGRRDSRGASLSGSNNNIPAPNNTFQTILTKFKLKGLNVVDLVALSGILTQLSPLSFRKLLIWSLVFKIFVQGATQLGMLGAPASGRGCTTSQETGSLTTLFNNRLLPNCAPGAPDQEVTRTFFSWTSQVQKSSTTVTSRTYWLQKDC
ncbi:PEROXIDASE 72-RELATED [Salix koriyanagi]|uniref:Peroxidase n=1 Tax=Salix koriyanagi TaxID=2511006 RepID=A0A9Q0SLG9_9ROSI|nr:PEROXIDASE 72-RELATED [Salix koriyanagi]